MLGTKGSNPVPGRGRTRGRPGTAAGRPGTAAGRPGTSAGRPAPTLPGQRPHWLQVLVVAFATLAVLSVQPAHILHHLHEDECHDPVPTRDDCSQCAVFHAGGISTPAEELSLHPAIEIQPYEVPEPASQGLVLAILPTSRAPPDLLAIRG
jgi:hypothetical protein